MKSHENTSNARNNDFPVDGGAETPGEGVEGGQETDRVERALRRQTPRPLAFDAQSVLGQLGPSQETALPTPASQVARRRWGEIAVGAMVGAVAGAVLMLLWVRAGDDVPASAPGNSQQQSVATVPSIPPLSDNMDDELLSEASSAAAGGSLFDTHNGPWLEIRSVSRNMTLTPRKLSPCLSPLDGIRRQTSAVREIEVTIDQTAPTSSPAGLNRSQLLRELGALPPL